jgi:hypothetical protein
MFVKRQVPDPLADSDGGDDWRKQLIGRLADIQVALWATEPEEGAAVPPDLGQVGSAPTAISPLPLPAPRIDPHLTAAPETVFYGLGGPAKDGDAKPAQAQGFGAWDELDEKRHLLSLARTMSTDSARARRSVALLGVLGVSAVVLLGLAGVSLLSETTLADVAGSFTTTDAARISDERPTETPRSRPLPAGAARFASLHAMEQVPVRPARNIAADDIAGLLAGEPARTAIEEPIIAFLDGRIPSQLTPRVAVDVSPTNEASLPFALHSGNDNLKDGVVLMAGLPGDVVPTLGSSPGAGLWSFRLDDLPRQKLRFTGEGDRGFALRLAIMRPNGDIIAQSITQIEAKTGRRGKVPVAATKSAEPNDQSAYQKVRQQEAARIKAEEAAREREVAVPPPAPVPRRAAVVKPKPEPEPRMALGASKTANTAPARSRPVEPAVAPPPPAPPKPKSSWAPQEQPNWSPFRSTN